MISRFRELLGKRPVKSSFMHAVQRLCLIALPALTVSGCGPMTSSAQTLRPISTLMMHIMSRATAVDALVNQLQARLDTLHPLEQDQITSIGLGPIELGMTIQEAANAAQVSFVVAPLTQSAVCKYYLPEVFDAEKAVRTGPIDGIGLMVVNDQIIRIDIWPDSPVRTSNGLGIGSTIDQVKAAYDGDVEVIPHPYTAGNYITLTPDAASSNLYSLVFETDQAGVVTQFRAGQLPAVTWTEGCS